MKTLSDILAKVYDEKMAYICAKERKCYIGSKKDYFYVGSRDTLKIMRCNNITHFRAVKKC
jgi:hypothetical protein